MGSHGLLVRASPLTPEGCRFDKIKKERVKEALWASHTEREL